MSNKKRQRKDKAKAKAKIPQSSRVDGKLEDLNEDKNMTEAKRLENNSDVLAGIDAQAARNIVIVNEEFAKLLQPATAEVNAVQVAILARFATRDAKFRKAVTDEFEEVDVPDEDLVGTLDN